MFLRSCDWEEGFIIVFDNDLTFNQRTLAKNSKVEMDGDTTLGFLLEKIYYLYNI